MYNPNYTEMFSRSSRLSKDEEYVKKNLGFGATEGVLNKLKNVELVTYEFDKLFEELDQVKKFVESNPVVRKLDTRHSVDVFLSYLEKTKDPIFLNVDYLVVVQAKMPVLVLKNKNKSTSSYSAEFDLTSYVKTPAKSFCKDWLPILAVSAAALYYFKFKK